MGDRLYAAHIENDDQARTDNNRGICQVKYRPMREFYPVNNTPLQWRARSKNSINLISENSADNKTKGNSPRARGNARTPPEQNENDQEAKESKKYGFAGCQIKGRT